VEHGEIVGLIGRNGAGKSTLLKILSRITEPTGGRARLCGRVGSLLEVGTGFHPELTGRENIYLNGALLGMTKTDINRRLDEIIAFAEIEKFVHTPVKRYSSGMYVRLAFAVAAHLEPEILLVDEVLAVGDAAFQKKCLGKMGDVAKEGRTILFVSHNLAAVESLCGRAIWLDDGLIAAEGHAANVVSRYLQTSFSPVTEQVWHDMDVAPGNDRVRLHRVSVRPDGGCPSDPIDMRTPLVMEFEYWNLETASHLNLSLHVYNEQGTMIFNTTSLRESRWDGRPFPAGLFKSRCYVPGNLLNAGLHRIELLLVKDRGVVVYQCDDALMFEVRDSVELRDGWYGKWSGAVHPDLEWSTELLQIDGARNTRLLATSL
jgi:lipopolysaccharide transport system ATP-binding protein